MRPDQIVRLLDLQERLADVVLEEADPDTWPGTGKPLADMTQQERGDRYWSKKNAAATFALIERTTATMQHQMLGAANPADAEADLDKQVALREREADVLLDKALKKAKKAAFDERTTKR